MMTAQEIKEEAQRRIAVMTEEEIESIWGFEEEDKAFLRHVAEVGQSTLNPKEMSRFRRLLVRMACRSEPGGVITTYILSNVRDKFGITREDIANGAPNPFKRTILSLIVTGVALAVLSGTLIGIGSNIHSDVLMYAGTGVATSDTFMAMGIANQISASMKYRKIQKQLMNGELDEELILSEVRSHFLDERQKIWEAGGYTYPKDSKESADSGEDRKNIG